MVQTSALGEREARIYRSTFDDGLLDLFSGGSVLLIGIAWLNDLVAVGAAIPAMLMPLWPWAKRRLTEPRLGYVRFREERTAVERRKLGGFFAAGVLALLAGVILFVLVGPRVGSGWGHLVSGLPAALLALPAVIAAFAYGLGRFLAYALVLVAAGALVIVRDADPGWALFGSGMVVLLSGAGLVLRFVAGHPVPEGEDDAAG